MNKIAPIKITHFCKDTGMHFAFYRQKAVLLICAATLCHSALCLVISVANIWSILCAARNPL